MPRTVQDILDHADELANRFEDYTPDERDERDPESFTALRDAVLSRSDAERSIKAAVDNARAHGYSWAMIGSLLGTSGEAARQRYATKQRGRTPAVRSACCESFVDPVEWVEGANACRDAGIHRSRLSAS